MWYHYTTLPWLVTQRTRILI